MKTKWIKMYLDMTLRLSEESHAVRLKVGAMFVSPDGVMSSGINGLPAGGDNVCEFKVITNPDFSDDSNNQDENGDYYKLVTRTDVSHAEENLFGKLMRQGVSTKNGSLFITHSPCINCSKIIRNAGIKEVYYLNDYRSSEGIDYLNRNGIIVEKFEEMK